jgi:hypothetical protein
VRTEYLGARRLLSWVRLGLARGIARWSAAALLAVSIAATPTPAAAADANLPANTPTIVVTGSSLANIVMSPLALTPAFDPAITDYVLRCQPGVNTVHASLVADGGTITAQGNHGASLDIRQDLLENEALVVVAKAPHGLIASQKGDVDENGRIQYWIRCLPHDFPQLSVARPGNPPPGWYLTSNVVTATGSSTYSMVLDNRGTPVWYQKVGQAAMDVTPLPDRTIAWYSAGVFKEYNPITQATRVLSSPDLQIDVHELHPLPNGDVMILSYPQTPNIDLTVLGMGSSATIFDCAIEELDPKGEVVWAWRASDHVSPGESIHPLGADIFHCNSIDTDPGSTRVLVSSRETDAVYVIDKATGKIAQKIGGNSLSHDHEQMVTITGDPKGAFDAQHDARFQPGGDISLFDDQSFTGLAARGVEYHIDSAAGTATLVWTFESPDAQNSFATGSFRRLNGGTDNVIGWGFRHNNSPLFTEVDAQGRVLLNVGFPRGDLSYRVVKVPPAALDHGFLRVTAGLPEFIRPESPKVSFVGSVRGPATNGASITITGAGFSRATTVTFGTRPSTAFTVNNDSSITAMVPPGVGVVHVTVTTPSGTSVATPGNAMTTTDSDFEGDVGSWRSVDAISSTSTYAQSGNFSMQVSRGSSATESVGSGRYTVPARSTTNGSEWVLTPQGPHRVRTFIAFYDANGKLLSVSKSSPVTTTTGGWTKVAQTTISPNGTTSASLGFEDSSGPGPVYLDNASLVGSDRFAYEPKDEIGT